MLIDRIRVGLRVVEETGEDLGAALEYDAVEMAQALKAVDDLAAWFERQGQKATAKLIRETYGASI